MSWKKHFQSSSAARKYQKLAARYADDSMMAGSPNSYSSRFASWLPEVYSGQPNRIERYSQYDNMDLDTEINMALDTIADSSTQTGPDGSIPFGFEWEDGITGEDIELLKEMLHQWTSINELNRRIHKIFRSVLKYGDQFFIRDPETYKLFWVAPDKVDSVIVDEGKGKEPEQYVIRDLDANLQTLVASGNLKRPADTRGYSSGPLASGQFQGGAQYGGAGAGGSRFNKNMNVGGTAGLAFYVNADNIVHLSLSEGLDNVWPFGISILENIFKTFKQKELIEDAIIIYRVQRAPERRIFYIDTGRLPNHRAMAYLERIKNEIQQKRIPSRTGGQGNVIDATYNPMCLILKEKIPLLDGRTLELRELIKEYEEGKQNWIYSCNPDTGEIVPGPISWAGVTKKNTQVIRLTFDNGKTLTCTPDHKIPIKGKGFVEAQNLQEGESLIPLYRKYDKLGKNTSEYEQVFNLDNWEYTHRIVNNFVKNEMLYDNQHINEEKNVIHHKDFNSLNNSPVNLAKMSFKDHTKLHHDFGTMFGFGQNKEGQQKGTPAAQEKIIYLRENEPELYREFVDSRAESQKLWRESLTEEEIAVISDKKSESMKEFLDANPDKLERRLNSLKQGNETTTYLSKNDPEWEERRRNKISNTLRYLSENDPEWVERKRKRQSESAKKVWKKRKEEQAKYANHKLVSIEWLEEKEDVGTLTIDQNEKYHSYHTFAIDAGIFIKNSMLEDYFFAQNSEGKGSRVETLPGGDQLGQIDDLKYFHHKLRTGLRVPRSYMPDLDDGGGAIFNDGRVGTAYIEELRFTNYCIRLQNLIVPHFDLEFKLFCKHRGINIHSSLFKLKFHKPQNFSKYRQTEVDGAVLGVYSQVAELGHISRRFGLIKYAGWTEEEVLENERMWAEENSERLKQAKADETVQMGDEVSGFGDVGASAAGIAAGEEPAEDEEELPNEAGTESPISGAENAKEEEIDTEEL